MTTAVIPLLAILAYCVSAIAIFNRACHNQLGDQSNSTSLPLSKACWVGVGGHTAFKLLQIQHESAINFGFFSTTSLVALIVVWVLLIATLTKPVEKLGIVLFPIAAIMLGFDMIFPEQRHTLHINNWAMNTHIMTSIVAFSLLNIAAIQAVLLSFQDYQLKKHNPKRFILSLPSLQSMESFLFQMITAGFVFLSISLVSGFFFIEDLFAQHLVHKTVLSIAAWIIFSGLLMGREKYGWRGQTAIKWTLTGFGVLLLAYFGSKLVLELILKR